MSLLTETIQGILPLYPGGVALAQERLLGTDLSGVDQGVVDLAVRMAGITGLAPPVIRHKVFIFCAADHGLATHLSAGDHPDSLEQISQILDGRADVCDAAGRVGAEVIVLDLGLAGALAEQDGLVSQRIGAGTADITQGAAMDLGAAVQSIEAGIAMVAEELADNVGVLAVDGLGVGGAVAAQAVIAAIADCPPADGETQILVEKALVANVPIAADILGVLERVGGFEIGGIAGVILGAAANRLPVAIGGLVASAGALIAAGLAPLSRQFMVMAEASDLTRPASIDRLGLFPEADVSAGDGLAAVLALGMIEDACNLLAPPDLG